jgi:hypothetical protein
VVDVKKELYEHLLAKLRKITSRAIKVDYWENCPFRRPGRFHRASCNLDRHPDCPDWEKKIPDYCPLREGPIPVELEEGVDDCGLVRK